MKKSLLKSLVCPYSNEELDLIVFEETHNQKHEIESGLLFSRDSNYVYPILNGIPRMLLDSYLINKELFIKYISQIDESYKHKLESYLADNPYLDTDIKHAQNSFSAEWSVINDKDRAWGRSPQDRLDEFTQRLDIKLDDLQGGTILDAGCGHGEIEYALSGQNVEIYAVDLSFSLDGIKKRIEESSLKATIHLIQANVLFLPFKKEIFDFVFSDGVLHHTPDTKKGFISISKTLKKGGKCFIMVYSYDYKNKLDILIDKFIKYNKWFFNNIPHSILHIICYALSPFYWIYLRIYNIIRKGSRRTNRSLKELGLSLFDAFSPKFDWNHSQKEVLSWYKEYDYANMKQTYFDHSGIGIVGLKVKN